MPLAKTNEVEIEGYKFELLVQFFADRIWIVASCLPSSVEGLGARVGSVSQATPEPDAKMLVEMEQQQKMQMAAMGQQRGASGSDDQEEDDDLPDFLKPKPIPNLSGLEPLVGPREDPLTSIVTQQLGNKFARTGDARAVLLTLGLPNHQSSPVPFSKRKLLVDGLVDAVYTLAAS